MSGSLSQRSLDNRWRPTLERSPVHHKTLSSLTYTHIHTHILDRERRLESPPTPPNHVHAQHLRSMNMLPTIRRFIGQITWSTSPLVSAMMSLRLPSEFFWHVNHDHGANLRIFVSCTHSLTCTHIRTYARVGPKSWLNLQIIDVANVFVKLTIFNLYTVGQYRNSQIPILLCCMKIFHTVSFWWPILLFKIIRL